MQRNRQPEAEAVMSCHESSKIFGVPGSSGKIRLQPKEIIRGERVVRLGEGGEIKLGEEGTRLDEESRRVLKSLCKSDISYCDVTPTSYDVRGIHDVTDRLANWAPPHDSDAYTLNKINDYQSKDGGVAVSNYGLYENDVLQGYNDDIHQVYTGNSSHCFSSEHFDDYDVRAQVCGLVGGDDVTAQDPENSDVTDQEVDNGDVENQTNLQLPVMTVDIEKWFMGLFVSDDKDYKRGKDARIKKKTKAKVLSNYELINKIQDNYFKEVS